MSRPVAVLVSVLLTVLTVAYGVPTAAGPGADLAVESAGSAGSGAEPEPTPEPEPEPLRLVERPSITGEPRWTGTLTARTGAWSPRPEVLRLQWLRDGRPVAGQTRRRFTPRPQDVGHRIAVRVTARRAGHAPRTALSRAVTIRHLVPVRRTVTYRVETRGPVTADLATFRRQAQQTFDDPRGWRAGGVAFRRVARGGDFSLVLATPEQLPRFSPVCSVEWSCRVGRYVVVNQTRWQRASPAWDAAGGSLRDYRHMVVNHETGHWLGRGHAGCPGRGRLAPVMMQQSKGLDGCRFNPWPTAAER